MMKLKGNSYFLIALLLLGLFGIGVSLTFDAYEATVLPLLLLSALVLLSAIQLTRELRTGDKTQTAIEEKPPREAESRIEWRRLGLPLGWVLGFTVGTYLLGFFIAIPLFVLSYLRMHGRSWLIAIVFATVTTAAEYAIFEFGLRAHLWRGLIFRLIGV